MSKETVVRLVDDLDGSEASVTYAFAWDGVDYEIDLSKKNAHDLENLIKPYVAVANRVKAGTAKRTARAPKPAGAKIDMTALRAWAAQNGHQVAERGRVASAVVEAFNKARNGAADAIADVAEEVKASKPARNTAAAKKVSARKVSARKAPAKKVSAVKASPAKRGRPAKTPASA